MNDFVSSVGDLFSSVQVQSVLRALAILLGGYLAWRLARRRLQLNRFSPQMNFLLRRATGVIILLMSVSWALQQLGVSLSVLLGAAGFLTVAIAFGARNSFANIIGGMFLIAERPFVVGDTITAGNTTGEVLSFDLMAIKVRTLDNIEVRVPNELIIRNQVSTLSRFLIRRIDIRVPVAYSEDLARVKSILSGIAERNPKCLEEPKPAFFLKGFEESSIDLQFSVWTLRVNLIEVKNALFEQIKKSFDENGVEFPIPHRALVGGDRSGSHPVRMVSPAALPPEAAETAA